MEYCPISDYLKKHKWLYLTQMYEWKVKIIQIRKNNRNYGIELSNGEIGPCNPVPSMSEAMAEPL